MRSQQKPGDPSNTHQLTLGTEFSSLLIAMRVYEPNSSTYQKVIAFSRVPGVLIFTWAKTKYKYAVPVLIQPVGLLKEADTEDN